jgi:HEAT repeat protein
LGENRDDAYYALIKALKDAVWFVRLAALQSLKELKLDTHTILQYIVPMLHDTHEDVREYAVLTINDRGPEAALAVPFLIQALSDPVWYVRERVAWVLGQIGTNAKEVRSGLMRRLTDDEIEVRLASLEALGSICCKDDTEVLTTLNAIISNDDQPLQVKEKVKTILRRIKRVDKTPNHFPSSRRKR